MKKSSTEATTATKTKWQLGQPHGGNSVTAGRGGGDSATTAEAGILQQWRWHGSGYYVAALGSLMVAAAAALAQGQPRQRGDGGQLGSAAMVAVSRQPWRQRRGR